MKLKRKLLITIRYITTLESNKFTAVLFALRLKRASIVRKVIMLISYEIQILIVN